MTLIPWEKVNFFSGYKLKDQNLGHRRIPPPPPPRTHSPTRVHIVQCTLYRTERLRNVLFSHIMFSFYRWEWTSWTKVWRTWNTVYCALWPIICRARIYFDNLQGKTSLPFFSHDLHSAFHNFMYIFRGYYIRIIQFVQSQPSLNKY